MKQVPVNENLAVESASAHAETGSHAVDQDEESNVTPGMGGSGSTEQKREDASTAAENTNKAVSYTHLTLPTKA